MQKMYGKVYLAFMVIIAFVTVIPKTAYSAPALSPDSDIPSDWAKEEIDRAEELNLLTESMQGAYKSSITREEFSGLAVKLYETLSGKKGTAGDNNPFTDTQNIEVITANNLGIVYGKGDMKFAPGSTATREEVSVMLHRTLKAAMPEYNHSGQNECGFSDQNTISSWALEAVGFLYREGIIRGVVDNCFNPGENTSREEAIVLVKRMYEKFSTTGGTIEKLRALIPKEIGKPYQYGGTGPDSYDCSGLVYSLFGKLGISLPRVAASQTAAGTYVAKTDLAYGDLVFFAKDGKNINHVGIYVGNGEFVHAPSTGDIVKATTLMSGYYKDTYYTARRVI